MKIQILSDLHLNFARQKPITIVDGVDVVVMAGDVTEGALNAFECVRKLVPHRVAVVMVMGNHEYYRTVLPLELALARSSAPKFDIHLLENDVAVIGGVRFLGATLFSNYRIFGDHNAPFAMRAAADGMQDHKKITWSKSPWRRFRPQEALLLHAASANFFSEALAVPFAGPSIAVSHMAPHPGSIDPRFRENLLTGAYVSDLSSIITKGRPLLWIHGHVHTNFDYRVGDTRIVCNPRAYPGENDHFDPALVLEISS